MARSEHCKGKTNEQLEDGDEGYPGIAYDFETMRQQRDTLAAALRWILQDAAYKAPEQLADPEITERWLDHARAALAKVQS